MRIAYVSLATPLDTDSWSGMPWYSFKEVSNRFEDVHLIDTPLVDRLIERLAALQRYGLSVRERRVLSSFYARVINRKLEEIAPDVVLSIGASHKLTSIDPKWRIIHVSDGLFSTMVNYYEKFGRFRQAVLRAGHDDMQSFLNHVEKVLFASDWARDSALSLYDIDPARLQVVPFGANIDADPGIRPRRDGPLSLIFVGYDWKRKGGDIVLEAWRDIRAALPDAELHIVGCRPEAARDVPGVKAHGRLRKADPRDYARLMHLYDNASMFFMPSREEAFGMVFCEAAAYGIPSVASATGGVPTVIEDGVTGIAVPMGATPAEFAARIVSLWRDQPRYRAMSQAARRRFETTLNWSAWGEAIEQAVMEVVPNASRVPFQARRSGIAEPGRMEMPVRALT